MIARLEYANSLNTEKKMLGIHRLEGFAGFALRSKVQELRAIERLKDVESCIDDPRDSQDLSQLPTLEPFERFKSLEIFQDPGRISRLPPAFVTGQKTLKPFHATSSARPIPRNLYLYSIFENLKCPLRKIDIMSLLKFQTNNLI